jgi:hypothetical protein
MIKRFLFLFVFAAWVDAATVTNTVGSGMDYTSLATWNAGVKATTNIGVALCYAGSDLGGVTIAGWTCAQSPTNRIRIVAEPGSRHSKMNIVDGAYSSTSGGNAFVIQENDISIEGMTVELTGNSRFCFYQHQAAPANYGGLVLKDIKVVTTGACNQGPIWSYCQATNAYSGSFLYVQNFIYYENNLNTANWQVNCEVQNDGAGAMAPQWFFYNMTLYEVVGYDGFYVVSDKNSSGSTTAYIYSTNNVSTATHNTFNDVAQSGAFSWSQGYCVSSDTHATDFGGPGNVITQTVATLFFSTNDVTPQATGALFDGGAALSGFSVDVIGTARPAFSAWDIGAVERVGSRRIISACY